LALAPTDIILTAAAAAGESSACGTYGEFLPRCRLGIKHLHLLLQQPLVQLQVVSAVAIPKQQQQEMQAALQAAAAPKKSTKRRAAAAAAAAANADGDMAQRFCWAVVSVELLPGFLFVPPATTTGFAGQQQQQQQCGLWSLHPDLAATIDWPSDAEAAAVNALMNMLQRQQHLCSCYGHMQQLLGKQQQQQQLRCHNGTAAAAGGTDDDGMHISDSDIDSSSSSSDSDNDLEDLQSLTQQPHIQQQQQQQQSGLMSSEQQLQDQLDLLRCPETAAAASEDVRQSMFDFVDSQPWQMEGRDPPGLACQLYR
jgi:hypothetical protein